MAKIGRPKINIGPCSVDGCNRDSSSRGWCKYHHNWWLKTGDVPTHQPGDMKHKSVGTPWPAKGNSKNWTRENLAWAAGFIDGEGCIEVKSSSKAEIAVSAFQKDPELLYRLTDIFGTGSLYKRRSLSNPGGHPDGSMWRVNRKYDVYAILVALYPWFSSRRQQQVKDAVRHAFPKD